MRVCRGVSTTKAASPRAIAYEIPATTLRRKPESRACNLLDFHSEATGIGHWIPAFAGMTVVNWSICDSPGLRGQGLFKVAEINHPLVLSLSKDGRRWFDNLTMSGGRRTMKRPCCLMGTHFNLSLLPRTRCGGWQSRRRSNGGSSTCVQAHLDCHVPRQARDERKIFAMTDAAGDLRFANRK